MLSCFCSYGTNGQTCTCFLFKYIHTLNPSLNQDLKINIFKHSVNANVCMAFSLKATYRIQTPLLMLFLNDITFSQAMLGYVGFWAAPLILYC